ncbi:prolyl oligopeptidase family serine peptidase [Usitatibacter palustris]|uniref:prolyl oligopeptidase n=1 Tax=Usitatibacter palustris TaxID=2732487 RepID=A0A6M4HCR9_9PROT|nr:prolyl oligopeptidase family serine peptidase [Usitatibacter palustris]QJR15797.1 Prolyl endopeptidase [Usitatibacter palustris]
MKLIANITAALVAAALTFPVHAGPFDDPVQSTAPSPIVRPLEVRETHHGVEVVDPYRWLEDVQSAESQAFFRDQAAHTRALLDKLPGRTALLERIRSLSEFNTSITRVSLAGTRVFYLKAGPGLASPVLCMREGFSGAERVLLDPARFSEGNAKGAIDYFSVAPDGRHVAYGVSRGGSENAVLRVLDAGTGKDLPVVIDRTRFNPNIGWHPDGRQFFYARVPEEDAARKRYTNVRLYRHMLGRDVAQDEIVFASGVGGARDVPAQARPSIVIPAEGRHAYAVVRDGVRREIAVHMTDVHDLAAGKPRWTKIVAHDDGVTAIEAWRDDVFLLTHNGAPRYRVLGMKAGATVLAKARVVVPEGDAVIQSIALAQDALYLRSMVGGVDRLERVPIGLLGMKKPEFVKTPFDNHIAQLIAHPRRAGAVIRLQSWIEAPVVLEVDARSGDLKNTKLQPPPVADFSEMDEVRLYAPGHDGTKIPVTLVYRKTTMLTADNPLILMAYGSYGTSFLPTFDPARLAWLERGGIIAVAHVRGGGEYGESWHLAGRKGTKENTIRDFISAAEFISKYGFTSPKRIAIQGTSAGGIPTGGALVRRPELFAAVVPRVAVMDMLRFEFSANGPANVPEFGSIATREGFEALRVMSSYHQVKDGTPYPAVLLTTGMNDPRVDAWQPGKMAARLQAATTSGKPVLLRVENDAGHGIGTTRRQAEEELADIYSFLLWQFGHPDFQPPAPPPPPVVPAPATVPAAAVAVDPPKEAEK